jgi:hypothetical protein
VGSQTKDVPIPEVLSVADAVDDMCPITLLFSPRQGEGLAGEELGALRDWLLHRLARTRTADVHLCVNDVGTLAALSGLVDPGRGVTLSAGSLLVGGGVPVELEGFLSREANPPRAVWDADGNPRTLTYREPPHELRDHWLRGLRLDARPSLQAALAFIAGGHTVVAEPGTLRGYPLLSQEGRWDIRG